MTSQSHSSSCPSPSGWMQPPTILGTRSPSAASRLRRRTPWDWIQTADEMLNPERQKEALVELGLEPVSPAFQAQHLFGSGPLFLPDSQHAMLGHQKHSQGLPNELLMQGKAYHGVWRQRDLFPASGAQGHGMVGADCTTVKTTKVPSPTVASIQTPALTLAVLRTASALKTHLTNRRGPRPVTAGSEKQEEGTQGEIQEDI
ncbi:uncharacterized protein [Vicugna pacos]|uniref:Uncharacterized protein n=1 Tax=Vicugna pacos TaxID=30538 RepID=A0ABM5CYF6_VICPA